MLQKNLNDEDDDTSLLYTEEFKNYDGGAGGTGSGCHSLSHSLKATTSSVRQCAPNCCACYGRPDASSPRIKCRGMLTLVLGMLRLVLVMLGEARAQAHPNTEPINLQLLCHQQSVHLFMALPLLSFRDPAAAGWAAGI